VGIIWIMHVFFDCDYSANTKISIVNFL
jgi:hypothetical protein